MKISCSVIVVRAVSSILLSFNRSLICEQLNSVLSELIWECSLAVGQLSLELDGLLTYNEVLLKYGGACCKI